jgi:hypothetical protein
MSEIETESRPDVEIAGTGRDRRLPERRQVDPDQPSHRDAHGRRPRDTGVTRDRKELLCEWSGTTFRLIDTGGVDREDTGPFGKQIAPRRARPSRRPISSSSSVDARAGSRRATRSSPEILRTSRRPVLVPREQARRSAP